MDGAMELVKPLWFSEPKTVERLVGQSLCAQRWANRSHCLAVCLVRGNTFRQTAGFFLSVLGAHDFSGAWKKNSWKTEGFLLDWEWNDATNQAFYGMSLVGFDCLHHMESLKWVKLWSFFALIRWWIRYFCRRNCHEHRRKYLLDQTFKRNDSCNLTEHL